MTVWAALGTVLGLPGLVNSRLAVVVAVVATVNLVVAAPLAALMRWALTAASEAGTGIGPEAGGVNPDSLPFRMTALAVVVACLFGALFVRLWYLQVLDSNQFQVAAQQNGVGSSTRPPPVVASSTATARCSSTTS